VPASVCTPRIGNSATRSTGSSGGRGLATEVAIALVEWHRDNPASWASEGEGPMRLGGYADVDNVASIRVLAKCGLHPLETREHAGRPYAFFRLDRSAPKSYLSSTKRRTRTAAIGQSSRHERDRHIDQGQLQSLPRVPSTYAFAAVVPARVQPWYSRPWSWRLCCSSAQDRPPPLVVADRPCVEGLAAASVKTCRRRLRWSGSPTASASTDLSS
jgi:hypothetical protein